MAGVHGLAGGGGRSLALQLVACTHYLPRPAVAPKPPAFWSIVAPGDNTHVMYTGSTTLSPVGNADLSPPPLRPPLQSGSTEEYQIVDTKESDTPGTSLRNMFIVEGRLR